MRKTMEKTLSDFKVDEYFSRGKHGSQPVRIITLGSQRWFEVKGPLGSQVYDSARQMLISFYGCDPHMTTERYFRLGRYGRKDPAIRLDSLFGDDEPTSPIVVSSSVGRKLGIDLATRSVEVKRILLAKFGYRIHRAGLDLEEVLQEVYKGLVVRNRGKCPWDVRISSFGHYVHMVCGCILNNYIRRVGKWKRNEVTGVEVYDNGLRVTKDVGEVDHPDPRHGGRVEFAMDRLQSWILSTDLTKRGRWTARLVPYVYAGLTYKAIGERVGLKPCRVSQLVKHLRRLARRWSLVG